MKFISRFLFAALLFTAAAPFSRGQVVLAPITDGPVVAKPVADFTVSAGTAQSLVKLNKTFNFPGLVGKLVRFSTTQGDIDVELLADDAPATVANFLNYVKRGDYNGSFIHRSAANFVIQGGGYKFVNSAVQTIPTDPPVVNEFKVSNTRGTLAMAKLGTDANSATDQWFFNESDGNASAAGGAMLDTQNGGFTVFGRIVGQSGLDVMDRIGALPTFMGGSPFDSLPVVNYTAGNNVTSDNLVTVTQIANLLLTPKAAGDVAMLKVRVKSNTNPGLVTPDLQGRKLYLNYTAGQKGSATITVLAKDPLKRKALATFTVTVE